MSDLICAVCKEPHTVYGVQASLRGEGDMLCWEAQLFLAAAGCPCCEGVKNTDDNEFVGIGPRPFFEEWGRALLINGGDLDIALARFVGDPDDVALPPWKAPPAKVLATCPGCKVEVALDPEDGKTRIFQGGDKVYYAGYAGISRAFAASEDPDLAYNHRVFDGEVYAALAFEDWLEVGEDAYCPGCVEYCDDCGETVIFRRSDLDPGDPYLPGASHLKPGSMRDSICTDCLEAIPTDDDGNLIDEDDLDGDGRKRPTRHEAESAIEEFLIQALEVDRKQVQGLLGDLTLDSDGVSGWSFTVADGDTTSYVHSDLKIEWYGTSWTPDGVED